MKLFPRFTRKTDSKREAPIPDSSSTCSVEVGIWFPFEKMFLRPDNLRPETWRYELYPPSTNKLAPVM